MNKRSFLCFLALFTCISTGCGFKKEVASYDETALLSYCDQATRDIFSRDEIPESLVFEQIGEDYSYEVIQDPILIKETMDAIREIHILGPSDQNTEDMSETYIFTMENGDRCMISFCRSNFETIKTAYTTCKTEAFYAARSKIIEQQ